MLTAETPSKLSLERAIREHQRNKEAVYRMAYISPLDINTLTQPREVFEGVPELAQSIARIGLISDLHVGVLDEEHTIRYLDAVNERWAQNHTLSELQFLEIKGQKVYLILIAGERRLRACKMLLAEGCPQHQQTEGLKPCFDTHHP